MSDIGAMYASQMKGTIVRPDVEYDDRTHTYTYQGEKLLGVSTVSKVGEDAWGPASWWGWKIGYEGATEVFNKVDGWFPMYPHEMREKLKRMKLTPNAKRDKRGEEGTWVHDVLENLAQYGKVKEDLDRYPLAVRGHVTALLRWYLDYRPEFVATEVQVASIEHGFAGRYDIRCNIHVDYLYPDRQSETKYNVRCLVDLKTGKRIYPTQHFVQLAGYELASVEMGFPPTDAQYVLKTNEDGSYEFVRSCARADHFLAYLSAEKAKRDLAMKAKESRG